MSRDEAIEAVENFFEDSDAARTFAVEIVDAAFEAVGFDADKTYYERGKDHTPRCNITILGFSPMEEEGGCTCEPIDVWVRVGEDTE